MKKRYKLLIASIIIFIGLVAIFEMLVIIDPPHIQDESILKNKRTRISNNIYKFEDSWLKKNKYGLWEMYVSGGPFEIGAKNGILTKELQEYQESVFVESIREIIPSDFYLNFLKYFIAWFNRDIDKHIPLEYQKEIYGVSKNASDEFSFIAPNYHRMLNYHAAHDIGHTIQNMNLVACTAFGVRNSLSEDSTLLIGRNMDFSSGDKFAKNKIISFYKPKDGYKFVYVTWAGLIGVISGMNDQGLTISLNAAKSEIPTTAKTPVSILAREILQYASTIEEAYKIAQQYETFVAESFFISSAKDNNMAIIEKTNDKIALYYSGKDRIISTNHYQSDTFKNRILTIENIKESDSQYRWNRVEELLNKKKKHNVQSFVNILRNQKGKNGKNIGMGNEKAMNQLIAHHSVVFKPEQLQMWVSVGPYQLGEYLCYNLNTVFSDTLDILKPIYNRNLTIEKDPFIDSQEFKNYKLYKQQTKIIFNAIDKDSLQSFNNEYIQNYIQLNPKFYYTYYTVGEYYRNINDNKTALKYYNIALDKEIPRKANAELIQEKIKLIK